MKSSIKLHLILIGSLTFFLSCQSDSNSIREVAHKYLEARLSMDFAAANEYVSEDSKAVLAELEDLSGEYLEDEDKAFPYKILSMNQDGNKAVVAYSMEGFGDAELSLVEEKGLWKVLLSPNSVPDEGLLIRDLQSLENEDTSDVDTEKLDAMLMTEDEAEDAIDTIVSQ